MTPPPGYAPLPPRQGYAPNPPPHGYAPMPSPPSFGALPPQHGHGAPQPQSTTAPQSPPGMQQRAPSWHDTPALQVAGGPKTVNAPAMPAPVPQAVNEDPIAPLAPQQTGPPIPAPVISETGLECVIGVPPPNRAFSPHYSATRARVQTTAAPEHVRVDERPSVGWLRRTIEARCRLRGARPPRSSGRTARRTGACCRRSGVGFVGRLLRP